jgi:hypothetical protein
MQPIVLPLVKACPAAMLDNPILTGGATPPTLTVQVDTESGQIYQLPLSVLAARQLRLMLANWPPASRFPVRTRIVRASQKPIAFIFSSFHKL